MQNDFFTVQSMLTLSGATGATFVISNGIQSAFNFNPKWLALVLAQIIVLLGVGITGGQLIDFGVGIINGFLVYSCAAGTTHIVSGSEPSTIERGGVRTTAIEANTSPKRAFLSPWF